MQRHHDDPRLGLTAIGFSPVDRLQAILDRIGWHGRVLSDPDRLLYRRLGIGRAPLWHVYSPGTLRVYARALAGGHHLRRPDEDTRQLGANAVMVDGSVVTVWRPRSPDDRPAADQVLGAASAALGHG